MRGGRPDPLTLPTSLPLEAAIAGDGVRTVVQPIVDLARGQVAGYEALTRFDLVPGTGPDVWFDAAIAAGVGAELEATTLARALARRADLPANCFLTVNVEPASLGHPAVDRVLTAAGDLRGVVLELTEHRPVDLGELGPLLRRHRHAGAKVAVDDAGAGYSGLQQILELRPDFLKLDRSLVTDVDRDLAKAGLVEMIGVFADRIDAWVIAEGIETTTELHRIADLGVPLGQGWALGRPSDDWSTPPFAPLGERSLHTPLRALLHHPLVAATGDPSDAGRLLADGDVDYVVVLDDDDRPAGIVDAEAAMGAGLRRTLCVNVTDSLAAVARRAAIRGSRDDVLVTDEAGRLAGAVSIDRLLVALADEVDPPRR